MGAALQKLAKRREVKKKLIEFYNKAEHVLVIHYSCETFYDRSNGQTPRVTSIAVRNLNSGQTISFSIHKVAEQQGIAFGKIPDEYNKLERAMLDEFFGFVRSHERDWWIHWNMRDINYGFLALEHRYKVLGGAPCCIEDSYKFDLARALVSIYGLRYAEHPRLKNLLDMNKICNKAILSGEQEADAFVKGKYVELHQSTLIKTDMMANIFERAMEGSLKTKKNYREMCRLYIPATGEFVRENWICSMLVFISAIATLIFLILPLFKR